MTKDIGSVLWYIIFILWIVYVIIIVREGNRKYRIIENDTELSNEEYSLQRKKITINYFKRIFGGLLVALILFLVVVFFVLS